MANLPTSRSSEILDRLNAAAQRRRRSKLSLGLAGSISAGTQASYASDQRVWSKWAESQGIDALNYGPRDIENWVVDQFDQGLSRSIIERRVTALCWFAEKSGAPYPVDDKLRRTLKGLRREKGLAPLRPAKPLTREILIKALPPVPTVKPLTPYDALGSNTKIASSQKRYRVQLAARLSALRDRAILLLGHASGIRGKYLSQLILTPVKRSEVNPPPELGFIEQEDERRIEITIHKSETDPLGEGLSRIIAETPDDPLCAVAAVRAWLDEAQITDGPVFRPISRGAAVGRINAQGKINPITTQLIAITVKQAAKRAGEDPAIFSGHSLRAGFVTDLLDAGVGLFTVADAVGHRQLATTKKYDRRA